MYDVTLSCVREMILLIDEMSSTYLPIICDHNLYDVISNDLSNDCIIFISDSKVQKNQESGINSSENSPRILGQKSCQSS